MVCQQAGPAWLLADRHPRITAGAIDDAALGVMTIGFRRAILLSDDAVYRHRSAIAASLMRAAG